MRMWEQLLTHNIYILALGDPGQLPPINPEDDNHVLDNPHVFLDEIMRQAQESEIIRLSMHVREGLPLSAFKAVGAQVQIYNPSQVTGGMYDWADQVLCATNQTRVAINNFVRQKKGFANTPQIGDKIISLRNHWDDSSVSGDWSLTNGAIGTITAFNLDQFFLPKWIENKCIQVMNTSFKLDNGDRFVNIPIDYEYMLTGVPCLNKRQTYLLNSNKKLPNAPYEFAYAYGITTHKAQGSEWDKVLVIEERFPFPAEEHRKWLYTACTRAKEKLVVISKD